MKFSSAVSTIVLLFPSIALGGWLTVKTTNGPITGHLAPEAPEIAEFLGIPYTKPPVGELRFQPPQRYTGWKEFVASDFSTDCVFSPSKLPDSFPDATPNFAKIFTAFTGGGGNRQSEDCLTLNIWTKGTWDSKMPVLVFIHGGRFNVGNTNTPFYNGQYFANAENVVVVTLNYRLGIFGFPGAPGEAQNLGIRDQRLAVEWLRDNIRAFGAYAYTPDPIISGMIAQSGTIFSFPLNSWEQAMAHWYNASTLVGCGSHCDVAACMRERSAEELLAAARKVASPPGSGLGRAQPPFQPVPDSDIIFDNYDELAAEGKFAKVPFLAGHTDYESAFYNISAWSKGNHLSPDQWLEFMAETFNCPTMKGSVSRLEHDVPVWRYRYFADWDNTRITETSGAYHGVDLHMIFGNSEGVTGEGESESQVQLKETMQKAWAAFATDPWRGLETLGWPRYQKSGKTLIRLGYDNKPEVSFMDPAIYDSKC